jgi:dolichyl-phosphate beta-glucosyltransferase
MAKMGIRRRGGMVTAAAEPVRNALSEPGIAWYSPPPMTAHDAQGDDARSGGEAASRDLSIVIPAYNEAGRIAGPLRILAGYLPARHPSTEIVVVDDGSTDDTAGTVTAIGAELSLPVRVVKSPANRGKGHAVRTGMLAARGTLILMTDADLSTPIDELEKLLAAVHGGADVAIGSRKMAGAVIEEHQPALREAMGRVFTWLTQRLIIQVSDVTCGFKLFRRDAARAVFSRATLDDWSFDAEALFLVRRLGYTLVEVPVRWRDAAGTKVNRGRDAVRSALGLVRIRWNHARGRYALDREPPLAVPAVDSEPASRMR